MRASGKLNGYLAFLIKFFYYSLLNHHTVDAKSSQALCIVGNSIVRSVLCCIHTAVTVRVACQFQVSSTTQPSFQSSQPIQIFHGISVHLRQNISIINLLHMTFLKSNILNDTLSKYTLTHYMLFLEECKVFIRRLIGDGPVALCTVLAQPPSISRAASSTKPHSAAVVHNNRVLSLKQDGLRPKRQVH